MIYGLLEVTSAAEFTACNHPQTKGTVESTESVEQNKDETEVK